MERRNAWHEYTEEQLQEIDTLTMKYRHFLDHGKTERECVDQIVEAAEAAGYRNMNSVIKEGATLKAGDKVYYVHMKKAVAMVNIGTEPIEQGMNILGAHIDSPRLDVKQNPFYVDSDLALLDTHYYGGIKKYQWVTMPLAIHGVVVKRDGAVINLAIGENPTDPVFCVTDLLPHLGQEQMEKKAAKVVEGEQLDLLIGSRPVKGELKDGVKAYVLQVLQEQYDFEEEDFLSAELEIVPAGAARELGFDRSMIIGYGQDDRVCAYTSLVAMLENFMAEVLEAMGHTSPLAVRRTLSNSHMLSSDVSAGFDPLYAGAFEKKNAAFLGRGVVFNKFTGSRGKSGSNDANAEYMARIRHLMDQDNISYQTAELGRVDLGGGGTIAYIMALYGMNVIDCGVAVLSMHSPWEVTSKADIYEAKRCYLAFLAAKGE